MKILTYALFFAVSLGQATFADTLSDARAALSQNDFSLSLELAEKLSVSHPLDAALIRAHAYLELGKFKEARDAAQYAVALDPLSFDARFLLGAALRDSEQFSKAKLQYRRAIDLAPSRFEADLARDEIARLAQDRAVQLSAQLALRPSSNLNRTTAHDEVELIFGAADITSDKPRPGIGLSYALGVTFRDWESWRANLSGFAAPNVEDSSAAVDLQYRTTLTDGAVFEAQFRSQSVSNAAYSQQLSASYSWALDKAARASFGVEGIAYAAGQSEIVPSADLQKQWTLADGVSLVGNAGLKRHSSNSAVHASTALSGGLAQQFSVGTWDIRLSQSVNFRNWDEASGLFPNARQDVDQHFGVQLVPTGFSYYGLRPIFSGALLRRSSNIAIYDIQSEDFYLGLQAQF